MKNMMLASAGVVLGLFSVSAPAQLGGAVGGSASAGLAVQAPGTDVAGSTVAGTADTADTTEQSTRSAASDVKRATRKSRRDTASATNDGASVSGKATAGAHGEARTPDK